MSSHWKDWFDFTNSERNGFLILIPLVLFLVFLPRLFPLIISKEPTDFEKIEKALALIEEKRIIDSLAQLEKLKAEELAKAKANEIQRERFQFDPNSTDYEDFLKLGLDGKLANTILNYREKGGRFYKKEDLQKIYGLSDSLYMELEDYIDIPKKEWSDNNNKKAHEKYTRKDKKLKREKQLIIEVNSADSLDLIKIRGIGPAFSSLILKYKNLLGGYLSKDQLLEVYGMDSSRWEKLIPHIFIDTLKIKKIPINEAEWIDLVRHPYIDKETANNIVNHREYNGYFEDVSDIKSYYLVKKRLYRKIAPYLTLDDRTETKKPH